MNDIPSQEKLEEITKKLAEILRIQDWDINFHLVSGYEIAKETENGDCAVNGLSYRQMRLNKADIYINKENPSNWYETLVHELIHVQINPITSTANAYFDERHTFFETTYENVVEKQAQVFCKLYPVTNFIKAITE